MATYTFSAERQVVFYVATADGRRLLVRFGERNSYGASNFATTDKQVAAAIRKHSMFQRGVIIETTPPKEKKKPAKTAPLPTTPPPAGEQDPDTGGETGGEQTPPPEDAGNADNVINADNFTLAKEAVMKRLGVDADAVKTPILLNKVCKDNGIELHIKRNR